ncbi:MAG: DUF72 domain-containing protein [Ignavibacteriales bacterium]|nr:DUF72 domain-containing protein [Ignavibacteriales bacterium]
MTKMRIGAAGWSYEDWVGAFYPKRESKSFDWLSYYSQYLDTAEVNASYYAYLSPKVAEGWLRKTEGIDEFRFTAKLHQDFTHRRRYGREEIEKTRAVFDVLRDGGKFGGALAQFPYSFAFDEAASAHVRRLAEDFENIPLFVEPRHASWRRDEARELVRGLGAPPCAADQPALGEAIPFAPEAVGGKLYVRLHGRNRAAWGRSVADLAARRRGEKPTSDRDPNERYDYLYSPGELGEIAEEIKSALDGVKTAYVIFNNHPGGQALANAFEMIALLEDRARVDMPETIKHRFERLRKIA